MTAHTIYPPLLDGWAWLERQARSRDRDDVLAPTRLLAERIREEDLYD